MRDTIHLYMWGYQEHFRLLVENRLETLLEALGAVKEGRVLLVGIRRPGDRAYHPICIDPEDGPWKVELFGGLDEAVEPAVQSHPDQMMFYTHEPTMQAKPERIRRQVVRDLILARLAPADADGLRNFCSLSVPVGEYDVAVVIQLPLSLFERWPPVFVKEWGETCERSFLVECVKALLGEAERALLLPEPGASPADESVRSAAEIIERAATTFMSWQQVGPMPIPSDLFNRANSLSQLQYEKRVGTGKLLLAGQDDENVRVALRFASGVPLSAVRWVRKLLEMAEGDAALLSDGAVVFGVGTLIDPDRPHYRLDFLGPHQWAFLYGERILLRCHFGRPLLPNEQIEPARLADNLRRGLPGIRETAIDVFREALDAMLALDHGSMLVIAADAASEAERLDKQGTRIAPTPLGAELLQVALAIDGSLIADMNGTVHAIGVILDGAASDESTPSRGSRYNSAVRYVHEAPFQRMAFVVSDDGTLDVVPLLRKRVSRAAIASAVEAIAAATHLDYHKPRNFLEDHRFYLTAKQCEVVNAALDRIDAEPKRLGTIELVTPRFVPNCDLDEGYFLEDGPSEVVAREGAD
jgi:hypothetical protein